MGSPSKEDNILRLILEDSPFKEWHFEEIVRQAKVTKAVANKWLKKYVRQGLLKHIKQKRRFPYFLVGANNPMYHSIKKVYALNHLQRCGLLAELLSMESAKTIIIFGSIAKGDWHKNSDIDVFIFGNISDFNKKLYEAKLDWSIEMHVFRSIEEVRQIKTGLIKNIINGYVLKGQIQDIARVV